MMERNGEYDVKFTLEPDYQISVSFAAYSIAGYSADLDGKFTIPEYEEKGGNSSADLTADPDKAQTIVNGFIKWDGCSHFYFGDAENSGYIHIDGGDDIAELGKLLVWIYRRCGELMGDKVLDDSFPK